MGAIKPGKFVVSARAWMLYRSRFCIFLSLSMLRAIDMPQECIPFREIQRSFSFSFKTECYFVVF